MATTMQLLQHLNKNIVYINKTWNYDYLIVYCRGWSFKPLFWPLSWIWSSLLGLFFFFIFFFNRRYIVNCFNYFFINFIIGMLGLEILFSLYKNKCLNLELRGDLRMVVNVIAVHFYYGMKKARLFLHTGRVIQKNKN